MAYQHNLIAADGRTGPTAHAYIQDYLAIEGESRARLKVVKTIVNFPVRPGQAYNT